MNGLIENLAQHCANCPVRRRARVKPHSIFARLHRWHARWWPGWKTYQKEQRARCAAARMQP